MLGPGSAWPRGCEPGLPARLARHPGPRGQRGSHPGPHHGCGPKLGQMRRLARGLANGWLVAPGSSPAVIDRRASLPGPACWPELSM